MLVSATIRLLDGGNCSPDKTAKLHNAAPYIDLLLGVALLIIGVLAVCAVINMTASYAWLTLGVGACYVGLIVFNMLVELKKTYSPNTCTIL